MNIPNKLTGAPARSMPGLIAFMLLAPLTLAADEAEAPGLEGLQLVSESRTGHLYTNPEADWAAYRRINLEEASVEFRKHWQRDQNRHYPHKVRDKDVEKIKTDLAALFDEVFSEELGAGYELVDDMGTDVLVVRPAITELDIAAPDIMRNVRMSSYTQEAGRMRLNIEILDSTTGDVLEKSTDKKRVPYRHWFQWTTSVSNRSDARRMLVRWAKDLRARLDEVRAEATG